MGWKTLAVIAQLVIIEGPGDGLFVYNGTPALGNLVASIAAAAGTDQEGNAYLAGLTSYGQLGPVFLACNLSDADVTYLTAASAAGPWTIIASIASGTNSITYLFPGSHGTALIGPSGDTTGVTDLSTIGTNLASGTSVTLTPGTFYLNGPLAWSSCELAGSGMTTIIQPGSAWGGAAMLQPGSNSSVRNLRCYGGTNTRSSNPAGDAIAPQAGAVDWWIDSVLIDHVNGWAINPAAGNISGSTHGIIRAIQGGHNAGGIQIASTTQARSAQITMTDVDLQNIEVNPAYWLNECVDADLKGANLSTLGSASIPTVRFTGKCGGYVTDPDVGVVSVTAGSTVPVWLFEDDGFGGSPNGITVMGGVSQEGGIGVQVSGGASRIRWIGHYAERNQSDGWKFDGTGADLCTMGCGGNNNNQNAGTAYDADITSTAHVLLDGFQAASGATTAGINITSASNHVTTDNLLASTTFAGHAANGW